MINQLHTFADGYAFYETLPGSNLVPSSCQDCGGRAYKVGYPFDRDLTAPIRCANCGHKAHGLPFEQTITQSTLTDSHADTFCQFAAGSLYCVRVHCSNPSHRT